MNTHHSTLIMLVCGTLALQACGGNAMEAKQDNQAADLGTLNPVAKVAFSGGILHANSRMISYSKQAGRLSVIDPSAPAELWGAYLPGFEFAVAHPDFQGASLFTAQAITVIADTARRDFPLHTTYAHAASADNHVAYSLAAADGRSFEVVRSLSNNEWQQEVMTVPWADTLPIAGGPANDSQPVSLITLFNADATLLVALAPSDGRYAVYSAASGSAPLVDSGLRCAGDGTGTSDDADFRSAAWDEGLQVFYLGDKRGRVYAIDPRAACVDWSSAATAALGTTDAINRISVYLPGQLGISQRSGTVTLMTYAGGGFGGPTASYESLCSLPLGSVPVGADHLLVYCATEFLAANDANTQSDPQNLTIDPYRYVLISKLDGQLTDYYFDGRTNAGVAIDTDAGKLYRVREGAFGRFDNLDLISGRITEHKGLFVADLLHHQ